MGMGRGIQGCTSIANQRPEVVKASDRTLAPGSSDRIRRQSGHERGRGRTVPSTWQARAVWARAFSLRQDECEVVPWTLEYRSHGGCSGQQA